MQIDLNADLGELGESCAHDAELMALVTSANIACGAHAGDPSTMATALAAARRHGVQVGAHPGYFDRDSFGRRELERDPDAIFHDCVYQIGALQGMAQAFDVAVRYVKPHGALYNQACRNEAYARPVVKATNLFGLDLMGLPKSALARLMAQEGKGRFVAEGFADRRYLPDGSLVPRSEPNAFVEDPAEAVQQVERLIRDYGVQTICVHGDNPQAVVFVRRLREFLDKAGFSIKAFA